MIVTPKLKTHSSSMPFLAFFLLLLLLLPPTVKGRSIRYNSPGWKLFHSLGKGFRSPHQNQMEQMRQNVPQVQPGDDCQGVFDLYLVLDKSGSVGDNWIHIYSFVEGLVKKFTNPNLRLSIITYSTEAEVILPLTSDRNEINKGLLVLKNIEPLGLTHMQKGLKKANEQIRRTNLRGRNVNSVIIALTDGLLLLKPYVDTIEEAKKARKMGAIIYTVGVFMYSKQQLVNIAGDPNHCFGVDEGFAALEKVIDPLTSNSCTEILSVQPTFVCAKDAYQVNVNGHGFNNTNDVKQVICRFTFNDARVVDESPSGVNEHSITCPGPKIKNTGEDVILQVSLNNGISFIGNKVIITSTNCMSTRGSQGSAVFNWSWLMFLPIVLGTLLLLCCTWKFCLKPKDQSQPPPPQSEKDPEKQSPPPELPPGPPDPGPAPSPGPVPGPAPAPSPAPAPASPPALTSASPPAPAASPAPASSPAPLPVNTNPTVIVTCCGCGKRDMQGELDTNYYHPNHQMPLVWCHPKTQGTDSSFVKPSYSQSSCRQKLRLCSDRDCFQPTERPYPTGAILQPNEEYVNMTQARCNPKLPFHPSQENLPVTQTLYSKIDSPPNQEHYTFNPLQSPCLTRPLHEPVRTGLDMELMPEDDDTVRTEGPDEARLSGLAGAEDQDIKI
ncbi:anthrax toxin receptor-like [Apodemus sylvaticus]|uniref:anthrax toxin receptor-like n=1 Tax=Apodemus sylvaticus TaxID=10129 RepID=UPI00224349FD|nr:anthrax toxin receptor-like [Apodemus sylvaticus]